MNKFHCEMFGHFIYDESLTYEELLDMEVQLIAAVQQTLEDRKAEHLDFTPLGDELMVQCVFDGYEADLFHEICAVLHPLLHPSVGVRLLFVDKHLDSMLIFHLNNMTFKETPLTLPTAEEALEPPTPPTFKKRRKGKASA